MSPVTAMMTFFPTDDCHNNRNRLMPCSHLHHGLRGTDCFCRLVQVLLFGLGQRHFDDALESRTSQFAGYSTEHIPETEFALEPGRAREDALLVQGNRLYHLHCG